MNSYSQVKQDLWVLEMLNNKINGFFLDIGAYDGIELSNSYLLEKDFQWNGICVEAHPKTFYLLKQNRKCTCVNFAITDFCGKVSFDEQQSLGSKISYNQQYYVDAIDFKQLFLNFNVPSTIDYMSLDIEGNEAKALSKFPFDTHKCTLITVEHNLYMGSDANKNTIKNILISNGYKISHENVDNDGVIFEDWYTYGID